MLSACWLCPSFMKSIYEATCTVCSIHKWLSAQAHCLFLYLLLSLQKPLPGLIFIPHPYQLLSSCFPPAPSTPVSTAPSSPLPTYAHTLILPPHTLSAHPQSPHPHFRLPPPLCPNTCPSLTSYSQPHGSPFPSPCILTLSSSSSYLSSVEQSHFIPRHYHITSPGISLLLLCLKRDRYPPVLLHPEFSLLKCLKLGDWVLSFHP